MSVQTMRPTLNQDDIRRLVKGESDENRAQAAHKICRKIATQKLSDEEKVFADQIMDMLSKDATALVRRAMAVTLRNSPKLPHDVALRLSQDIETIAVPVIQNSPVFTNSDLIEIVLNASDAKQVAVSGRDRLPGEVTDTIAEHGCRDAVMTVMSNDSAAVPDRAFEYTLSRFKTDQEMHEAIVSRDVIPTHIAEKMISLVTGEIFDYLVNHHELPPQLAIDLATGARERATIDLVEQAIRSSDVPRFVQQLNLNGRLTPSLIMRCMCVGQMSFVEWALAELSGVSHGKAWLMIHDAGSLGLKALFDRAGLPQRMLTAFKSALTVYHETDYDDGTEGVQERFRARMIERVLTQFQAIPKDDLTYLLEKLDAYAEYRDGKTADTSETDQPSATKLSA